MDADPGTLTTNNPTGTRDASGTCQVCGRHIGIPIPVCFCCRTVASQLGLPLVPLFALSEYRVGDQGHHRLRAYKDAPVAEVRAWCRGELVAVLARWFARPESGWPTIDGATAVVTAVPSSRRPGPPPAERLIEGVPMLAAHHLRLLARGPGDGGHLQAGRDAFTLAPGVDRAGLAGLSVLVFDDTTTTGAAAQSAAATLRLAGARVSGVLVMGRALAPSNGLGSRR